MFLFELNPFRCPWAVGLTYSNHKLLYWQRLHLYSNRTSHSVYFSKITIGILRECNYK